jgi:hypothetical protein
MGDYSAPSCPDEHHMLRKQYLESGEASLESEALQEEELVRIAQNQQTQAIQAAAEARKAQAISEIEHEARQQELEVGKMYHERLSAIRMKFQQRRFLLRQQMNDLEFEFYQERAQDTQHWMNIHALHREYQKEKMARSRSRSPSPPPPGQQQNQYLLSPDGCMVVPPVAGSRASSQSRAASPFRAVSPHRPFEPTAGGCVTSATGYASPPMAVHPGSGTTAVSRGVAGGVAVPQVAAAVPGFASPETSTLPAHVAGGVANVTALPVAEAQFTKSLHTATTATTGAIAHPYITASDVYNTRETAPAMQYVTSGGNLVAEPRFVQAMPGKQQVVHGSSAVVQPAVIHSASEPEQQPVVVPDGQGGCWYWMPDDEEEEAMPPAAGYPAAMPVMDAMHGMPVSYQYDAGRYWAPIH